MKTGCNTLLQKSVQKLNILRTVEGQQGILACWSETSEGYFECTTVSAESGDGSKSVVAIHMEGTLGRVGRKGLGRMEKNVREGYREKIQRRRCLEDQ